MMKNLSNLVAKRRTHSQGESGVALVMTAIFAIVFCGFVAFGVDLGHWYLQAERIQRAADNAALAAATSLPSESAAATGFEAARKNGYENGGRFSVSVDASGSRATVNVRDNKVPTFFAKFFFDHLSIGREAVAEKDSSLPMGSPFNVLGTGDLTLPMRGGGTFPKSNMWLAINGECTAREDGDYFSSHWLGNKGPTTTQCPGAKENKAFNRNGYSYFIDVPGQVRSSVNVKIFDPRFHPLPANEQPRTRENQSPDIDLARANDGSGTPYQGVSMQDTGFILWEIDGENETKIHSYGYRSHSENGPAGEWVSFTTIPSSTSGKDRKYRLQVMNLDQTFVGSPHGSFAHGENAFSIWADTGDGKVCDSRTDNACPQVYGKTAVSLLNNVSNNTSGKATFMLAGVPKNFAGSDVEVSIFDPGEGVNSIEVLKPNGQTASFDWEAFPPGPGATSGVGVTSLPTTGSAGSAYTGDDSAYRFNDRRVVMKLHIPSDPSTWMGPNNNNWWQIQYTMPSGAHVAPDRTTWGANLGGNGPSHLVKS